MLLLRSVQTFFLPDGLQQTLHKGTDAQSCVAIIAVLLVSISSIGMQSSKISEPLERIAFITV